MRDIQQSQERYLNDPTFHHMVDSITHALLREDITIPLLCDAVQLAFAKYTRYTLKKLEDAMMQQVERERLTPEQLEKEWQQGWDKWIR